MVGNDSKVPCHTTRQNTTKHHIFINYTRTCALALALDPTLALAHTHTHTFPLVEQKGGHG